METLFEFTPLIVAIIPITVGLVQIAKIVGCPRKWKPVVSIIFATGLIALTGVEWQQMIAQGIIAGLSASGLYTSSKAIRKKE